MAVSRFVAPGELTDLEQARAAFQRVQEQLDALAVATRLQLITSDVTLRAGEFIRISPRQGRSLFAKLPKAGAENVGATITISLERPNGSLVLSSEKPDTVNGVFTSTYTSATLIELVSNGVDQWVSPNALPTTSPIGAALDAEYVLGAAHPSLPNGIVPTDARQVPRVDDTGATVEWEYPLTVGSPFAWIFDGIDDFVSAGDVLDMDRTTARSIFAWYATESTSGPVLVGKQASGTAVGWRLCVSNSTLDWILRGTTQQLQAGFTTPAPLDGSFHMFGLTYDGSSSATGVQFYLDTANMPKTVGTNNLTSESTQNATNFTVGARGAADAPFPGGIQHVSVWNRVLTAGEVAQLSDGGVPADLSALSFFADCILWYKLDATDVVGAGGIDDHSASGFNGTAQGGLAPTGSASQVHTLVAGDGLVSSVLDSVATIDVGAGTHIAVDSSAVSVDVTSLLAAIDSASIVVSGGTLQRAALIGDVTASQNSNTTAIAAGVIVNADVNAAAAIDQTKLAATTGFSVKASGSAATTSAEPIVTYSASANMSAERVTTSSTSVAVSTSVAGQIEFQRAALTGEVTASANANATTVVRSTNFATAPWTGSHTWSGSGFFTVNTLGDVSFTSAIFGAVSSSTLSLSSVGAMTLASSAGNVVVSALALYLNGDGFLLFDSAAASTPSLTTQQGLIWVAPSSASAETLPRYTDGSNADRYMQLSYDSFLTSTATGAIGTAALKDDQNVFRWNGGANADIDGFSGNLWNGRQLLVRNASGTLGRTLTVNHDSAVTASNGVHGPANAAVVVRNRGSSLLTYDTTSSRWFHTIV